MADHSARFPDDRDDAALGALQDAFAAGAHDDALLRLTAAHLDDDAESALWADARFAEWWGEEARERSALATRRLSHEEYLAAGRALRSRAAARRLGAAWHAEAPPLRPAAIVAPPAHVLDDAAAIGATPLVDLAVAAGVGRELWDEPADTWLAVPPALRAARPAARHLAVRIAGDSMEPAMRTGDTVLVALGTEPKAGVAVVARHPDDGYVCKRVRRVRGATIELESLAPGRPLIVIPRRDDLILGTVVAIWSA